MTATVYQAIELNSHKPVGPARKSIHFARSDAYRHKNVTGRECAVCKTEIAWTTFDADLGLADLDA